jgi:hypothetical protein
MVSVLDSTLANHTITIGNVEALTSPAHVQALDIIAVDGQPVSANNFAARDLVTEIAALNPTTRPDEIGTPWPIHSPGFFTDSTSANSLHLAFESPGTNSPPAGAVQQAAVAAAIPQAGVPGAVPQAAVAGAVPPVGVAGAVPPVGVAGAVPPVGVAGAVPGQAAVAGAVPAQPGVAQGAAAAVASPAVPTPATPGRGSGAALAYARSMIGKLPETGGDNVGPALDKFEADYGFHGAAWCGIFAGHVLEAAGLKPPHSVASVAAILQLAQNGDPPFLKGVLPISAARPGDLVTFGGTEHVAVVTKIDAQGVHTIAGNTGPGLGNVGETLYAPGDVTGVVRPDYGSGPPLAGGLGATPPAGPPAAPAPGAPAAAGAIPPAGAGVAASPAAVAAAAQAPAAVQPGNAAFQAAGPQGQSSHLHTVQFMQAVTPQPGSPLAGVQPGTASPSQVPPAAAGAGQIPASVQPPGAVPPQAPPGAPVLAASQVAGQGPGALPVGGSISVSASLLTSGQATFAAHLSQLTGLSPRVIAAWALAEESGGAAQGRQAASNFNWLNIGYFDSGAGQIAFDKSFSDPVSAAEQTAKFLKGNWGGASSSIRAILSTVGQSPDQQMQAIANSDWASSHYGGGANLRGTYQELGDLKVTAAPGV